MKHNILNSKLKAFMILLISIINNPLTFSNSNKSSCTSYLNSARAETTKTTAKATFLDSKGKVRISKQAFLYGGQAIDTKKFRAPNLIEQKSILGKSDASMIVDNFLHGGKYYKAVFKLAPEAIKSSFVQTMPFPIVPGVMAGHVQARFVMNKGYEIELLDPKTNQNMGFVEDMIVSYEAALPVGASYNFGVAALDSSPLVGRLVSGQQKLDEGPERAFNQYLLPLSGLENAQLLNYFLNDSINIGMNFFYNTVVRNCTTQIFDGIDTLFRFLQFVENKSLTPFLTTIGGDPVIGPAINGLLERFGTDVRQVQDMKDEYKNIYQDYGTPKAVVTEKLPFAPGGKDPMNLLIMTLGTENLNTEEKQIIDNVVNDIINDLPNTLNMLLASAFSLAEDLESSPKIIQAMTDVISTKLKARIAKLGDKLPNTPISIQVAFTPYPSATSTTDLRSRGLRAQLPFSVQRLDLLPSNKSEILNQIQKGIADVDRYVTADLPAFLKNFTVHIKLQKGDSDLTSQFLLALQPTLGSLKFTNDQVDIKQFNIPKAEDYKASWGERLRRRFNFFSSEDDYKPPFVNLLLTHNQDLDNNLPNPMAYIKFGPEVVIQPTGQMLIPPLTNAKYLCWSGTAPHAPQLMGRLESTPLEPSNWFKRLVNKTLKGKQVTFSITDIEMNLQDLNIKTIKVRVGALGLRCLDIDSVNKQFGSQANDILPDLIQKITKKIGPPQNTILD